MAEQRGPTLRAQWLGNELREMREAAGLTLKEVGEYLRRNSSTVSRFESGILPARIAEVLAYLDICGIDDPRRRDDLKQMAQDVWQKGWWDGFTDNVAGSLIDWVWLESRATAISSYQNAVIPGLLQTRAYAEAMIGAADVEATPEQVNRFVELRMARQDRLELEDSIRVSVVLDEGVLYRRVGGSEVMREQFAHLRQMAQRKNIEVLVIPAAVGAHASPDGAFDLFAMARPYPMAACISTPAGTLVVEGDKAERLRHAYDRLREVALPRRATLALLAELQKHLE